MRSARVWKRLLGVEHTVIEQVRYDEDGVLVALVRPTRSRRGRCGLCQRRCPGYDQGEGRRRWRTLDLGTVQAFLEADAPRVRCRSMGWWPRRFPGPGTAPGSPAPSRTPPPGWRPTPRASLWPSCCGWRGAPSGGSSTRVAAEQATKIDLLEGLRRIGIDELSYRRASAISPWSSTTTEAGWCGPRQARARPPWNGSSTPSASPAAPRSSWSARTPPSGSPPCGTPLPGRGPLRRPVPRSQWATDALDQVRRKSGTPPAKAATPPWRGSSRAPGSRCGRTPRTSPPPARQAGPHRPGQPAALPGLPAQGGAPAGLQGQRTAGRSAAGRLAIVGATLPHPHLRRPGPLGHRLPRPIVASLLHGASNARVESVNTRLRLLTRIAFGFRSTDALIGLAMLSLGGLCPPLPGR